MALQLCEILRWMNHYIVEHPDKEENRKKCICIRGTEETDEIGIIEYDNGVYHIGEKYLLNSKVALQYGGKGKKVKVMGKDENKSSSRDKYPYFAYNIQPLE